MFNYPESMVDDLTNYKNMEEGISNPMRTSVEKEVNEDNERSTSVTMPTGLVEINNSPKFVFKKPEKKTICKRMIECIFRHILFSMLTFILIGTGIACLILWLLNPDIKFD